MNAKKSSSDVISRRQLFKNAGRILVGGALVSPGLAMTAPRAYAFAGANGGKPLDHLQFATFSSLIGETFRIQINPSESVAVKMVEAVEHYPENTEQECFSIMFQGAPGNPLPQGTYHFHHHRTKEFELFIVPVSADGNGSQYEAVVNRLRA